MEKYLVPPESTPTISTSTVRRPWKRSLIELNGRLKADYRHELYSLLAHSYSEIGYFPHVYHVNKEPCETHLYENIEYRPLRRGITGLEFDNQGRHIVSVTRSGCLTVHNFESLYCNPGSLEDESKHVVHFCFPLFHALDVARWNPTNQNEIACTSRIHDKVLIFDISCMSPEPTEILRSRQSPSSSDLEFGRGLYDIAITSDGDSRIFSSYESGTVKVWDRRASNFPCTELSANIYNPLESIQIYVDNQTIFGAGREGIIHVWDLRGGRNSTAIQSGKDMTLASLRLVPMLQKISSLKTQTKVVRKDIHSINLNPSSPHQLAFHLEDGWSGVLDLYKSEVTHVHCPPPAWLDGSSTSTDLILRKPSWLPTSSRYVVGSMTENGIHILDFHSSCKSPCHVDYDEDSQRKENRDKSYHSNKFVSLSQTVRSCSAHPLNSMIVAGTGNSSLLLVAQRQSSTR